MNLSNAFAIAFLIANAAACIAVPVLLWTHFRRLRHLESRHDNKPSPSAAQPRRGHRQA